MRPGKGMEGKGEKGEKGEREKGRKGESIRNKKVKCKKVNVYNIEVTHSHIQPQTATHDSPLPPPLLPSQWCQQLSAQDTIAKVSLLVNSIKVADIKRTIRAGFASDGN